MFNLEKLERVTAAILLCALIIGLGLTIYYKARPAASIKISRFDPKDISGSPVVKEKININEAGVEELSSLKGIGKSLAGRIIEYRNSKGLFTSTEDIKNVKGIGSKLFDKIKDRISVE